MRITRETLLKIAKDTVTQQVRSRHDLVSVFLIGSLLTDDPLLGGTTDIDLIFIHVQHIAGRLRLERPAGAAERSAEPGDVCL